MPARGKLIAFEGIDGAGKRTQIDLLSQALARRGVPQARYSFPRYDSFFGRLVARYLNGDFGPLDRLDAHFSALLFAGDRLEAKGEIEATLAQGKTVLTDRYIASNLAHQAARVELQQREEFLAWLRRLEYEIYRLPAEDLVVYLRLPAAEAQRLVGRKAPRDYTKLPRDRHEADLAHLEKAAQIYDQLATSSNWASVECFDTSAGTMHPPEIIHRGVIAAVEVRLAPIGSGQAPPATSPTKTKR
jgi:dTMP kinase